MKLLSRRRLTRWLVALAVAAALLLMAGELAARYALGLGTPPLVVSHPSIEYMFAPNQHVRRFGTRQLYNRYGMRAEDFSEAKAEGEFRVMVLGDSVINGGNLTDHEDVATSIVRRELAAEGQFSIVTVGNISAGSWGPGNLLAYAEAFGFFDADLVVLVLSSHDYNDNPTFGPLDPSTHPTERPPSALLEGVQRYLPKYLPSLLGGVPSDPQAPAIPAGPAADPSHDSAGGTAAAADVERGLADLRRLVRKAQEASADVRVVQYLNKQEVEGGELEPGHNAIRGLCEELGVSTRSTQQVFEQAVAAGKSPFRDSIHPNDLGQRLLAKVLLEAVQAYLSSRELDAP